MKFKIQLLILIFFLSLNLGAQEKYEISVDFKDLSFKEFVIRTERLLPVKFFYKDEWLNNLKLGNYSECTTLSCVLDNLFRGTTLHYLIEESGNIVITNNYAVKVSNTPVGKNNKFLPPTDYSTTSDNQQTSGNASAEIGNPAEKNKPGSVIISGYINN